MLIENVILQNTPKGLYYIYVIVPLAKPCWFNIQ